jgi:hypothetical protein
MSSIPTPDASTIEHPVWCYRKHCETTDTDVRHVSRVIKCTSKDAVVELYLVRSDEFMFLGEDVYNPPEIVMSLECTAIDQRGQRGASGCFDAFELQRVLCQAFGLAALAQYDGALLGTAD